MIQLITNIYHPLVHQFGQFDYSLLHKEWTAEVEIAHLLIFLKNAFTDSFLLDISHEATCPNIEAIRL